VIKSKKGWLGNMRLRPMRRLEGCGDQFFSHPATAADENDGHSQKVTQEQATEFSHEKWQLRGFKKGNTTGALILDGLR
jgi:hypothetical protein